MMQSLVPRDRLARWGALREIAFEETLEGLSCTLQRRKLHSDGALVLALLTDYVLAGLDAFGVVDSLQS